MTAPDYPVQAAATTLALVEARALITGATDWQLAGPPALDSKCQEWVTAAQRWLRAYDDAPTVPQAAETPPESAVEPRTAAPESPGTAQGGSGDLSPVSYSVGQRDLLDLDGARRIAAEDVAARAPGWLTVATLLAGLDAFDRLRRQLSDVLGHDDVPPDAGLVDDVADRVRQTRAFAAANMVPAPAADPPATATLGGAVRPFALLRHVDLTGLSDTGIVAWGAQFPDGAVSIRWRGARPSSVFWNSLDDAMAIHGHGGATEMVWLDAGEPEPIKAGAMQAEIAIGGTR